MHSCMNTRNASYYFISSVQRLNIDGHGGLVTFEGCDRCTHQVYVVTVIAMYVDTGLQLACASLRGRLAYISRVMSQLEGAVRGLDTENFLVHS